VGNCRFQETVNVDKQIIVVADDTQKFPDDFYLNPDCTTDPICARSLVNTNFYRNSPIAVWRVLANFISIYAMLSEFYQIWQVLSSFISITLSLLEFYKLK